MKTCFYYYLIEPVRDTVKDDGQNIAFEVPVEDFPVKAAFLTYEDGQPKAFRFEISSLETESIPEAILDVIHASKEHFLTSLQVSYERSARYSEVALWNFVESEAGPSLNVSFSERLNPPTHDILKSIFISGMKHRHLLQLLAHGADTHFPMPIRFLSLYKLVEHRFKREGKWNKDDLKSFLKPYDEIWKGKGFSKAADNLIHDIRDRCAHARMNSDELGIVTLNRRDAAEVEKVMTEMLSVGRKIVSDLTNGAIGFGVHTGA